MAQFCTQCGSEIQPGSKFCIKCGKNVETNLDDNRSDRNLSTPVVQTKPTSNNNKLLVPLIVTLLVIGGIGGYILLGRSTGNINTAAEPQSNPTKQTQQATKPAENVPIPKETPKEEKAGLIIGVNVNARKLASTDSSVVGTFTLGEKVIILTEESEWAKVKRSDGQECYVFKKFLGDQAALDKRQAKYSIKSGPYPVFLNGDPDYVLCDGHMGSAWYLIKSSIRRSPRTNMETIATIVSVSDADKGNTTITHKNDYSFFYNDAGMSVNDKYIPADGSRAETMVALGAGELVYYTKTKHPFYKGRFDQSFYDRLNP